MLAIPDLSVLAISPDQEDMERPLTEVLPQLIRGGVSAFMFREKRLSDSMFVQQGSALRHICEEEGADFILNERIELAEPLGASIVHVTWKTTCQPDRSLQVVGRSVHSLEEAQAAMDLGADYLLVGPIFPTPSKEGLVDPLGLDALAEMCRRFAVPSVAVGGIKADAVDAVKKSGAVGVAGISCFFAAADPLVAARQFRAAGRSKK